MQCAAAEEIFKNKSFVNYLCFLCLLVRVELCLKSASVLERESTCIELRGLEGVHGSWFSVTLHILTLELAFLLHW